VEARHYPLAMAEVQARLRGWPFPGARARPGFPCHAVPSSFL